jgi:hypothetical protein
LSAGQYTIVTFGLEPNVLDGGFARQLEGFIIAHPEVRIVSVTPINHGAATSAVVVVAEVAAGKNSGMKLDGEPKAQNDSRKDRTANAEELNPSRPRPRPQVVKQQNVRPAIFPGHKTGTKKIGAMADDGKWNNYRPYLQRVIETVQSQWEVIIKENRLGSASNTHAIIVFRLNKIGAVESIVSIEGTAGDEAKKACVSAVTAKSPYGAWNKEMVTALGDSQDITLTFYHQ